MMQRYQVGDEPKKGSVVTEVIPGGMGIIYVVEFTYGGSSFKRAIKSCDVERGLAPDFRATFERESLLWISLPPHPRVVRAFSFEFDGGLPNLMMEYMPGGNLRARMKDRPMALTECLRIAVEFCDGMRFLTDNNRILHLDIKPENVLFDESGHVKITDFGLARAYIDPGKKARASGFLPAWAARAGGEPNVVAGTMPYMAPEQLSGTKAPDTRADVYAFGVMLYEMLAGRRPFDALDARSYGRAIAKADIAPLPADVPRRLRELILRCLSDDPRKRFPGFADLLSQLVGLCEDKGVIVELEDAPSDTGSESRLDANDWNSRGYAFAQSHNFDEALRCYQRGLSVLAIEPRSNNFVVTPGVEKKTNSSDALRAVLNTNMGALLVRMGRVGDAKAAFESALAVVPDDGVAYLRLGQIALLEGKIAEGLTLLKKSTECEPGNFDLLLKYLRACLACGDSKETRRVFDEFLAAKRSDGPFLVAVGCVLDDEFGLGPALRCFDAALEFNEDSAIAWYNKGVALQRADKDALAIESYKNVVRLDRHHPFARCYLGILLIRCGQNEDGVAHLKRFLGEAAASPLTELVATLLRGAELGVPLEQLLQVFSAPETIKHAV
jgi:serine/threonine protein kinase/Flp pilus assembly protein TadD